MEADLRTPSAEACRLAAGSHVGTKAPPQTGRLAYICCSRSTSASLIPNKSVLFARIRPSKASAEPRTRNREVGRTPGRTARRRDGGGREKERGSVAAPDESPARGQEERAGGRGLTTGVRAGAEAEPAGHPQVGAPKHSGASAGARPHTNTSRQDPRPLTSEVY